MVGLGCTPLNTVTGMPPAASAPATLATTAVPARPRSVTMTAAWQPVPRTTAATASTAPAPKCAGGMGSSTSLVPATGGMGYSCGAGRRTGVPVRSSSSFMGSSWPP